MSASAPTTASAPAPTLVPSGEYPSFSSMFATPQAPPKWWSDMVGDTTSIAIPA